MPLHEPDIEQQPQLQPQEDLPCFLSLIILTMMAATTPINARETTIDPALSMIH